MAKPKHVVVGVNTYRIYYSKKKWLKYAPHRNPDEHSGLMLPERGVILLTGWQLTGAALRDTVVHEILHALFAEHSFANMPGDLPGEKSDLEEYIILLITPHLLQVLMDNPELFDWIRG